MGKVRSMEEDQPRDMAQHIRQTRIAGIQDVLLAHPRWFPQDAKDLRSAESNFNAAWERLITAEHEPELPTLMQSVIEAGNVLLYRQAHEAMMTRKQQLHDIMVKP